MDLQGLKLQLEALRDAAAAAAAPAATAMGENFRKGVADVTLTEIGHGPGMFWLAPRGRPPAHVTGNLARSIRTTPASGSPSATAFVAAYAEYAALQEFGGSTWANGKFMKWQNNFGVWYKREVNVPAHPYFRPTLTRQVSDGSLSDAAATAFWDRIAPVIG